MAPRPVAGGIAGPERGGRPVARPRGGRRTIAVAAIHGMGDQSPGFAAAFHRELVDRVAARSAELTLIGGEVAWGDVLAAKQRRLLARMEEGGHLDYRRLRGFVLEALGDAVAYQQVDKQDLAPGELDVYAEVHDRVAAALEELAERAGARAPLVVVAHSLGSVIASNYIWDCQKGRHRGGARSPLARCRTVTDLFFLASPLALWSLRYRDLGKPIRFPIADPDGVWLHLYDPDDALAFPVKAINRAYERAVTADVEVDVGGPLTSWNPLSHFAYWGDATVVEAIARALARTR